MHSRPRFRASNEIDIDDRLTMTFSQMNMLILWLLLIVIRYFRSYALFDLEHVYQWYGRVEFIIGALYLASAALEALPLIE